MQKAVHRIENRPRKSAKEVLGLDAVERLCLSVMVELVYFLWTLQSLHDIRDPNLLTIAGFSGYERQLSRIKPSVHIGSE
jgi:hypothetical protein